MEDDNPRRDEAVHALQTRGFEVLLADDAGVALEHLSRDPQAFTLVVTDLDIEPIGGFNLARAIHRRWSSVPVAIALKQFQPGISRRAQAPVRPRVHA